VNQVGAVLLPAIDRRAGAVHFAKPVGDETTLHQTAKGHNPAKLLGIDAERVAAFLSGFVRETSTQLNDKADGCAPRRRD